MSVHTLKVTIGAAATQFSSLSVPFCWARIEADDENSNPVFIGDSTVTAANGQRLNNSATVPEDMIVGPFAGNWTNLNEWWVTGTAEESINILYNVH